MFRTGSRVVVSDLAVSDLAVNGRRWSPDSFDSDVVNLKPNASAFGS